MRILLLTSSPTPKDGYSVVGANLCAALTSLGGTELDVYSGTDQRRIMPGRNALKSQYFERFGWLAVLFDLFSILWTARGKRYDLIHCNVEHFAAVAMLLGRWWNIPFSITAHGTYGVLLPVRYALFSRAFAAATKVVAVSQYTRSRMMEEGVKADISVITNGVDTSVFSSGQSPSRKENLITYVGNLKARKGFSFLLDALKVVVEKGISCSVVAIGGSFTRDSQGLVASSKRQGLPVTYVGAVNEHQLVEYYRKAKLNVLPSKSERFFFEGFGLIHLEANACGTLTVGTMNSGNEDAIAPGNGFLVPYGDVDKLADVIIRTLAQQQPQPTGPTPKTWRDVALEYELLFGSMVHKKITLPDGIIHS